MTSPFPRISEGGTYVVDGLPAVLAATGQTSIPVWMPNTAYAAQYVVLAPTGQLISRNAAGTSGSSYAAETAAWTVLNDVGAGGGGVAINDAAASSSSTWSSQQTAAQLATKAPVVINTVYRHGPPTNAALYPVGTFVVDVDDANHLYEIGA